MAIGTPSRSARRAIAGLEGARSRSIPERLFGGLLLASTVVAVIVLAALIVDILIDGAGRVNVSLLTSYTSRFADQTGYRAGITGTLSLMVLTALLAFPVGVGAAIYLEEFAPVNRLTRLLEANIANLASVPSVVYGLLGAGVFVYFLAFGRALIVGAITLALLVLPVIIVAGRESLRAVPRTIRDAGLALGATPLQVTFRQVLPLAFPGILTGTILALSRAIGETAPILVAGAIFSRRADNEPWHLFEAYTAMPIQIFDYVKRPQAEFQVEVAAAGILVLLAILLVLNSAAVLLRNRYARKY